MSRIARRFAALQQAGRKALIPYVTVGDPSPEATAAVLHALVAGGADILELGVPFSDPMADGPVIQAASERALAQGVTLAQVLQIVRDFRATDAETPVVLMGYANPVERYEQRHGAGGFARDAAAAGVDGLLIVDYPPEECEAFAQSLKHRGLDLIFLIAPTTTDERIARIGALASGYVYYVSLTGVTGAGHLDTAAVAQALPRIRRHVQVPVGVGFGIRDGASARAVAQAADGVVVGSALVGQLAGQSVDNAASRAQAFMATLRQAMDA